MLNGKKSEINLDIKLVVLLREKEKRIKKNQNKDVAKTHGRE